MIVRTAIFTAALATLTAPATAQTIKVEGGISLLSDSISNGHTLSDGNPSLQGYVEADIAGFFAEIYFATVGNGTDDTEIDYTLGYRNRLASGFQYKLSYSRYTLNNTGDCCGQVTLELGQTIGEKTLVRATYAYDPTAKIYDANLKLDYAIADKWAMDATIGREEGSHNYASLGLTYYAADNTALILRVHDSSDEKPRVAAIVEYYFTLFSR